MVSFALWPLYPEEGAFDGHRTEAVVTVPVLIHVMEAYEGKGGGLYRFKSRFLTSILVGG